MSIVDKETIKMDEIDSMSRIETLKIIDYVPLFKVYRGKTFISTIMYLLDY